MARRTKAIRSLRLRLLSGLRQGGTHSCRKVPRHEWGTPGVSWTLAARRVRDPGGRGSRPSALVCAPKADVPESTSNPEQDKRYDVRASLMQRKARRNSRPVDCG